jgi:putative nucleotidyltransferase with HDIG domain
VAKRRIRLRGVNGDVDGKIWENETLVRAGRLATLEIVLDDSSVSRRHAEIRPTAAGWRVKDLGSTNGTFINGTRLGAGEYAVKAHDIVRCGNVTFVIDHLSDGAEEDSDKDAASEKLFIQSISHCSWDDALSGIAFDREKSPRPGEQLLALLRAGHHLVHLESEEILLHTILNDAVSTLDAQRGAIVLADNSTGPLRLRALATGTSRIQSRTGFSQSLAQRSFSRGESILCQSAEEDPELAGAQSIAEGTMASILCILLRTPRKRLGVLHLDRGPMQKPFSKDDLHLADALAAHVSAGIESAQLIKKQRELFHATIAMLAQAVELRDPYTGGHTVRVTEYSMLLGTQLELSREDMELIRIGTPLHDIGKIGIDDAILRKPGKLTAQEFDIMKSHTTKGAKILEQVGDLASVIPIVRSHHERWDGFGYPDGLAGENIPRLARIVGVCDAFDAMTSDRPYRQGMPADVAFAEVEKQKGKQFDPEVANVFIQMKQRILQEMQSDTRKLGLGASNMSTLRLAT